MRQRGRRIRRPTAQSGLRSLAQGLLRPLCACFSRAVGEMPYTEWAIWGTGIMIMMCAAKKRVLILAVGGGFVVAARKRVLSLAVGGGFVVAARKRVLILAVGGGFIAAAKKRGLILAVGGGFVVAGRKRDRLEILCRVSVKWRLCGRGDEKK